MDERTYQLIALGGIALIGAGAKIYYSLKEKNTIRGFVNRANNYLLPQVEILRNTLNDFEKASNELVNKLEKRLKK